MVVFSREGEHLQRDRPAPISIYIYLFEAADMVTNTYDLFNSII